MKQEFLFDEGAPFGGGPLLPVAVIGSTASLTKAQKQFNKLVAKIAEQRRELAQWQAFIPIHLQRCSVELDPLIASMREKGIAKVRLLDAAMEKGGLTRAQQAKVQDILMDELASLLQEAEDAELVQLYDKYNDVTFEEERQLSEDAFRSMVREDFGIEPDSADQGTGTIEELAQRVGEKIHAEQAARSQAPKKGRSKSAKALAQAALQEQAQQGAVKSMREVYRKLVGELHPDREPDAEERMRKTELMKKVNQAYEAGDLLALLELQLAIEQIDHVALASLAEDRLAHYILTLTGQSQRLQDELMSITQPLIVAMHTRMSRRLTPEAVERAMNDDMRDMRLTLQEMDAELLKLQDIRELKRSLKSYRSEPSEDEIFREVLALMTSGGKKRRR